MSVEDQPPAEVDSLAKAWRYADKRKYQLEIVREMHLWRMAAGIGGFCLAEIGMNEVPNSAILAVILVMSAVMTTTGGRDAVRAHIAEKRLQEIMDQLRQQSEVVAEFMPGMLAYLAQEEDAIRERLPIPAGYEVSRTLPSDIQILSPANQSDVTAVEVNVRERDGDIMTSYDISRDSEGLQAGQKRIVRASLSWRRGESLPNSLQVFSELRSTEDHLRVQQALGQESGAPYLSAVTYPSQIFIFGSERGWGGSAGAQRIGGGLKSLWNGGIYRSGGEDHHAGLTDLGSIPFRGADVRVRGMIQGPKQIHYTRVHEDGNISHSTNEI